MKRLLLISLLLLPLSAVADVDENGFAIIKDLRQSQVIITAPETGKSVTVWDLGNGYYKVIPQGERKPGDARTLYIERDRDVLYVRDLTQPRTTTKPIRK